MKHPQTQTSLSGHADWGGNVHMDQTWVNIITAYCSSLEWSGADFFFKCTLVALIPRSIVCRRPPRPSSSDPHHSSHLVMRRFGQKESKHCAFHEGKYTHVQDGVIHIDEIPLRLKTVETAGSTAWGHALCLHSAVINSVSTRLPLCNLSLFAQLYHYYYYDSDKSLACWAAF